MANNQKTSENLEDHTVAELKEMADDMGIDVPSHATKSEIIEAIQKGGSPEQQDSVTPLALTNTITAGNVQADAYGIGKKYFITTADLVALGAFTTGTIVLDALPAGAVVRMIRIKHTQSVAGPSITAATAQVATANNTYGSAFDIFQAVANTAAAMSTVQPTSGNVENFATTTTLNLNLTTTGANFSVVTTGALWAIVRYELLA
jgi:hypothetical protein